MRGNIYRNDHGRFCSLSQAKKAVHQRIHRAFKKKAPRTPKEKTLRTPVKNTGMNIVEVFIAGMIYERFCQSFDVTIPF